MRKIIAYLSSIFVMVVLCLPLVGCTKPVYDKYFNDFTSTAGFSALEKCLTLPKGIFIDTYFENEEMFAVKRDTGLKDDNNNAIFLYGIASKTELLVEPAFLSVIDIKGSLAIVSRLAVGDNNQVVAEFGLIKIVSKGLYSDMTTFKHAEPPSADYSPVRFVGNLVAILGDRYGAGASDHFTFYSADMVEQFKVQATGLSEFVLGDNYLVHYPNPTYAEFFKTEVRDGQGYLIKQDKYAPFLEEDIAVRACDIVINYLGNGWFLRTATVAYSQSFVGYNIKLNEKSEQNPYLKKVSDRYQADTKTTYNNQTLLPVLAANCYNRAETRAIAAARNTDTIIAPEDKKPLYQFPTYPVSELIRTGYTLVYTYFYLNEETKAVDVSFAILDGSATEPTVLSNLYMPLLFVDGVGFEVSSPYFNPFYSNAEVRNKKNEVTLLEAAEKEYSYASVAVHHGGMSIVRHIALTTAVEQGTFEAFRGASRQVPFGRYDNEFTPYFSGIATASIYNRTTQTRSYYALNEGGGETPLAGVYSLKNGVFLTETKGAGEEASTFGLLTNSGQQLLAGRTYLQVYESFLKNGKFVESLVFTEENGGGVVYKII